MAARFFGDSVICASPSTTNTGAGYGWPECHFDDPEGMLELAPASGGDVGKSIGAGAAKWASRDLSRVLGAQRRSAL